MQLFHFIAAWLFPGAVSKVAQAAIAESFEPDNASSLAFSVKTADDSGSSISSSSSSSSSSDGHPRFFTSRQEHSHPASPLCFGAGGGGVGRLLLRGSRGARARSPTKHDEAAAAAGVAPAAKQHGDVVGRYLRKISSRLRTARRTPGKGSPSPTLPRRAADDTARERAETVARAMAYCKDTLRRGAAPPRPPPSPSLDDWLHDRQEEIIASAAAYCDRSTNSQTPGPRLDGGSLAAHRGIECRVSPPPPPRPHRAGELAQMQVMGKQVKESMRSALSSRENSITASDVVHGNDSPPHGHDAMDECRRVPATMAETALSSSPSDLAADELEMRGSFDDMEFLNIFDGDEEMINRHFITIQI
ncbi:hypothetical protein SETIT_4G255600v2 [Setaria italica]|uniref:Uncharacterized protein n=1 Tax=Setaria italica TaxID=4555 RepID=A0A368QYK5_SETIT|nr:hypothetical protein SETIT_4G255600v2 [Setaria italica]